MVTEAQTYKVGNMEVKTIMQLDKSKVYLFQFKNVTGKHLDEIKTKFIDEGFREDCMFISCEDLNIYEVKDKE